jgi:plastocyanin
MRRFIAATVALAAFVVAGPAGAATWQVYLGEQAKPPAGTPKGATLNMFLPASLQIHAGDKVKFSSMSFHTASYLGGTALGPPNLADPAKGTYSGINDSTGAAFYFNSLPKLVYNVPVFAPVGGTTVPGKGYVSTGALSPSPNGKPGTSTLTFPKVGTYKLICTLHAGMTGIVVVRAAGATVPDAATVKAAATAQIAAGWAKAPALAAAKPPAKTVYVGNGAKTTLLAYVPTKLTVKAGTTVNFVNKSPSEPHNVAFGPKAYILAQLKKLDLFPFGPGQPNQVLPFFVYGSEPAGGYVYDGTNHGNGFLATPLTDTQPGSPPRGLAGSYRIKFTKAGKYHYFCMLHGPDMAGDIVVTP